MSTSIILLDRNSDTNNVLNLNLSPFQRKDSQANTNRIQSSNNRTDFQRHMPA